MTKGSKILVLGASGLVGSALVRRLLARGYNNLLTPSHEELDLFIPPDIDKYFKDNQPDYVFICAAKAGGIVAQNKFRADYISENLKIAINSIEACHNNNVQKILYYGSSCIYPRNCPQPIKESYLLSGHPEYTNEPYSIAKIAGMNLCESYSIQHSRNYLSVMPTNIYGPGDNYDLRDSHVLPALVRKLVLAHYYENGEIEKICKDLNAKKQEVTKILAENGVVKAKDGSVIVKAWGSPHTLREFMHSDDLADASIHIMEKCNFTDFAHGEKVRNTHINVGSGEEVSIQQLLELICRYVCFRGTVEFDSSMPSGTPRKLLDLTRLQSTGWKHSITLEEGVKRTIETYETETKK